MGRAYPIELTNMCMLQRADGKVLVQNRRDGYSCKMAQAVLSFWKTEYFKGGKLR